MPIKTQSKTRTQIDTLLNKADKALTGTSYFECEALCVEAIEKALRHGHYDQAAQAAMPLLEARRQRRVAAVEAGIVGVISGDLPHPPDLHCGVYVIEPPRVGIDGKRLRDAADKRRLPIVALVREPDTQAGLVPIVAIAQRTVRTKVRPPASLTVDWVLDAIEALGQTAIDDLDVTQTAAQRTEYLWMCVQTLPDHEQLHKLFAETAHDAAQEVDEPNPSPSQRPASQRRSADDEDDLHVEDLDVIDDDDDVDLDDDDDSLV